MPDATLRAAVPDDVQAIETLVRNAYGKYVERIGKPPAPMTADYRQLVDEGDVWVLELEDRAGRHLLGDLIIEGEG